MLTLCSEREYFIRPSSITCSNEHQLHLIGYNYLSFLSKLRTFPVGHIMQDVQVCVATGTGDFSAGGMHCIRDGSEGSLIIPGLINPTKAVMFLMVYRSSARSL